VVTDRETRRSRGFGFGFVEMSSGADEATQALDMAEFQGRTLTVNEAKPREDRPRSGEFGRRYLVVHPPITAMRERTEAVS